MVDFLEVLWSVGPEDVAAFEADQAARVVAKAEEKAKLCPKCGGDGLYRTNDIRGMRVGSRHGVHCFACHGTGKASIRRAS